MVWEREFTCFGAEQEKDSLYKAVLAISTLREPLFDYLRFNVCVWDIGHEKFEMYSRLILFNTRYVSTALLYSILFETVIQPSPWNIWAEGAVKSACKIMRAARFCSFERRSVIITCRWPTIIES